MINTTKDFKNILLNEKSLIDNPSSFLVLQFLVDAVINNILPTKILIELIENSRKEEPIKSAQNQNEEILLKIGLPKDQQHRTGADVGFNEYTHQNREQYEDISVAAANAITILNMTGFDFSLMNLSGISIAGANLSYGIFEGTNFTDAQLQEANFTGAYLKDATFNRASMNGIQLGMIHLPFSLTKKHHVLHILLMETA